jgi:hypothetical protein
MAASSKWPSYAQPVPTSATADGLEPGGVKLQLGFGDGDGGGSVDAETQRYVDIKVDAMKAQNDARFSEVLSKLDAVNVKIDHAPRPLTMPQFLGGAAGALGVTLGVVFAILAYASDRFDGGIAASAVVGELMESQTLKDQQQDAKLDQILGALSVLTADAAKPEAE